jgi:hypothetical protein
VLGSGCAGSEAEDKSQYLTMALPFLPPINTDLLALTGTDEFHARLFDGKSGQILWDFAPEGENALPGAPFGQDVTTTFEDSNLIILNQGANVRKIHAKAGTEAWHWKAEEGSPTAYFGVLEAKGFSGHDRVVYVTGVTRGIDSFTIEVVALDSTTGQYLKTFTARSKLASVEEAVVLGGGSNDKPGYLAWLEKDALKVLTLGTDKVTDISLKVSPWTSVNCFICCFVLGQYLTFSIHTSLFL